MELELNVDFKKYFDKKNFFFGVANAPYLCEGGYNYPDGLKNSYAIPEMNGKYEKSGEAIDFWNNYAEHIKLAASLGLNAFRMGIDWSRCQPSPSMVKTNPPAWDTAALDHYADIVEMVIKNGMEPIITLHHFAHPLWLGADIWLEDEGPQQLVDYEGKVVYEINTRLIQRGVDILRHFLVYNEPNEIPGIYYRSGIFSIERQGDEFLLPAYDTMLAHYIKGYDRLYDLFEEMKWGKPHVGFTLSNKAIYEYDKMLTDIVRLRSWGVEREHAAQKIDECRKQWRMRMDDLAESILTDKQRQLYYQTVEKVQEKTRLELFKKTLDALYSSKRVEKIDYLSVNVYEPFSFVILDEKGNSKFEWEDLTMDTQVYRTFIHATNDFNTGLPVYMGENTCSNVQKIGGKPEPRHDGWTREDYLKSYLMEIVRAVKLGVPIKGYLYWSLVDDFEWHWGFTPRLGLYNYDYTNKKILATDGFGQPSGEIYATLIQAMRSGDKDRIKQIFRNEYKYVK